MCDPLCAICTQVRDALKTKVSSLESSLADSAAELDQARAQLAQAQAALVAAQEEAEGSAVGDGVRCSLYMQT